MVILKAVKAIEEITGKHKKILTVVCWSFYPFQVRILSPKISEIINYTVNQYKDKTDTFSIPIFLNHNQSLRKINLLVVLSIFQTKGPWATSLIQETFPINKLICKKV